MLSVCAFLALWSTAAAQDPIKAFPGNYSLVFENDAVAVIRVHYGPHEKVGVHDHSAYPTIYVYLNDSGPVRFAHFEEKAFTTVRPPAHTGAFRVAPARPERHTVENLSEMPSDFLRVELKRTTLKLKMPFRGVAPATLTKNLDEVEFKDGQLEVERVVCAGPAECPVKAMDSPSLFVAITPANMVRAMGTSEQVEAGSVHWIEGKARLELRATSSEPAEVLRIVIPKN